MTPQRGFSLVEVGIAVGVLMMGAIALIQINSTFMRQVTDIRGSQGSPAITETLVQEQMQAVRILQRPGESPPPAFLPVMPFNMLGSTASLVTDLVLAPATPSYSVGPAFPGAFPVWGPERTYQTDDIVVPTVANGYYYRVHTPAGTSAGSEPSWPKELAGAGRMITDGSVGWTCAGNVFPPPRWKANWTNRTLGELVMPTVPNGFVYCVAEGGSTGATEPRWPTRDGDPPVTDSTVKWVRVNPFVAGLGQYRSLPPMWAPNTPKVPGALVVPVSPTAGYVYEVSSCTGPCATGPTEPTWANYATPGSGPTDGTITWVCRTLRDELSTWQGLHDYTFGDIIKATANSVDWFWQAQNTQRSGNTGPPALLTSGAPVQPINGPNVLDGGVLWKKKGRLRTSTALSVMTKWGEFDGSPEVNDECVPKDPNKRTGYVYAAIYTSDGAIGGSEPFWPAQLGATVIDSHVVWVCRRPENPLPAWNDYGAAYPHRAGDLVRPSSDNGRYYRALAAGTSLENEPTTWNNVSDSSAIVSDGGVNWVYEGTTGPSWMRRQWTVPLVGLFGTATNSGTVTLLKGDYF